MSIGIGESLLLARIATKKAKPAGSYHLKREDAVDHLAPLPLSILPGFGYNTIEKIKAKYMIGCDGAHRWTRKQLNITVEGYNTDNIW